LWVIDWFIFVTSVQNEILIWTVTQSNTLTSGSGYVYMFISW
jgi:hypothetical protein